VRQNDFNLGACNVGDDITDAMTHVLKGLVGARARRSYYRGFR
jgi:hypothetical protein